MSFELQFLKNQDIVNQNQILELLDGAFGETRYSINTKTSFFTGYKSKYPNFLLLYKEKVLVGVAIIAQRLIKIFAQKINAITVGPLAIGAHHQKKGYSKYLFSGLDKIAIKLNADLIYLQGLDGFYSKYEFFPCLAKSKIEIHVKDLINVDQVIIKPFTDNYLKEVKNLYKQIAKNNNCTSYRNENNWLWLTKYAKQSYYHYRPFLIIDKNDVVGYFCSDPDDKSRLREVIYTTNYDKIASFLFGIKQYAFKNNLSSVEIMTPPNSVLVKYIKKYSNGVFTQYIRPDGGELMKIINYESLLKIIKKNMFYGAELDIIDINDNIFFKLTNNNETNKIITFKCKKKHFPGIITGYLDSDVFFDYNYSGQNDFNIFKRNTNDLVPFIYQGDNY